MNTEERITLFIDEDCPLCSIEYAWLSRLNGDGRVLFIDISDANFDATEYGLNQKDFEHSIRARWDDGSWIEGVEAFRCVYEVLGFTSTVKLSRVFPISLFLYFFYEVFRRLRVPFGRMFRLLSKLLRK